MNAYEVAKWERVKSLCDILCCRFVLEGESIKLYTNKGKMLGSFRDSMDVYHFLCGYEYYVSAKRIVDHFIGEEEKCSK